MTSYPRSCRRSCTGAALALAIAACAQGESPGDTPAPADASASDASRPDAREVDPVVDASSVSTDAMATVLDAAVAFDAGVAFDASSVDAATADARVDATIDARVDAATADASTIDAAVDAAPRPDASPGVSVLYASSESDLYRLNPASLAATRVGGFQWPDNVGVDAMADLAVAADGSLFGASATRLYRIDPTSARATVVANLGQATNALAFVPPGTVNPSSEALVAATLGGDWLRIDPSSGAITTLGHYSSGKSSSGDLAHVPGIGIVATVSPGGPTDLLARVAANGATTGIGSSTGAVQVWGLAYAGGRLVGFTLGQDIVTIDTTTGVATRIATGPTAWYGAAGR